MKAKLLLAVPFLFLGCHPTSNSKTAGYVDARDMRWPSHTLTTCFEQEGFEADKAMVAQTIDREYAKAGFTFQGWQLCGPGQEADLKIVFDPFDHGSRVSAFGKALRNVTHGVQLGLSHNCSDEFTASPCQANVVLHEFGHALGLHHEMNRRDNHECLYDQVSGEGESSAYQVGDYDKDSIMDYCNIYAANEKALPLSLSQGDLETLKAYYDMPFAFISNEMPVAVSSTFIQPKIAGYGATRYRYKFGPLDTMDCKDPAGYVEKATLETSIPLTDFFKIQAYQMIRFCLLGGNDQGQWQSYDRYTSTDFTYEPESRETVVEKVELTIADWQWMNLDIYLQNPSLTVSEVELRLDVEGKPSLLSRKLNSTSSAAGKILHVSYPRYRAKAGDKVHIGSLRFTHDGFFSLIANSRAGTLLIGGPEPIPNTFLQIPDDGSDAIPSLQSLELRPEQYPQSGLRTFELKTLGEPKDVVLEFTGAPKLANSLIRISAGHNLIKLSKQNLPAGDYRLTKIRLINLHGESFDVAISANDAVIPGTISPVPVFTIPAPQ